MFCPLFEARLCGNPVSLPSPLYEFNRMMDKIVHKIYRPTTANIILTLPGPYRRVIRDGMRNECTDPNGLAILCRGKVDRGPARRNRPYRGRFGVNASKSLPKAILVPCPSARDSTSSVCSNGISRPEAP